jgi:hypothetical protein
MIVESNRSRFNEQTARHHLPIYFPLQLGMANPMRMRTIPKIVAHETPTLTPANPTTRPIINKAAPTNPLKFIILAPLACA